VWNQTDPFKPVLETRRLSAEIRVFFYGIGCKGWLFWKDPTLRYWVSLRFLQLVTIACSFIETGQGAKYLLELGLSSALTWVFRKESKQTIIFLLHNFRICLNLLIYNLCGCVGFRPNV
jgi:hypothetical protein